MCWFLKSELFYVYMIDRAVLLNHVNFRDGFPNVWSFRFLFITVINIEDFFTFISDNEFTILIEYKMQVKLRF